MKEALERRRRHRPAAGGKRAPIGARRRASVAGSLKPAPSQRAAASAARKAAKRMRD
jgi:hypothetical protein